MLHVESTAHLVRSSPAHPPHPIRGPARDGSRICDVFHSDFHLVSLDFCYSSDISNANPTKEKKIYFVLWMAGNIIFGRKPKEIAANQANWINFPEESFSTGAPE
jgi:hypothetical protein